MARIRLAVRQLIEFVMRSGDIDNTYRSNRRMVEGIKAHQRIQSAYGPGYSKEVVFRNSTTVEEMIFEVEGRADGVYISGDTVMIDEIKSTTRALDALESEHNPLHWAQAKCYAYFCALERRLDAVEVQLTYVNLDEAVLTRKFIKTFTREELGDFYRDLLVRYLAFSRLLVEWRHTRDASILQLRFPYKTYRKGQREFSVGVFRAIEAGKPLFIEAPTSIGKTMSAIVPAIASLAHAGTEKVFYLTAKTTTQREPERAIAKLASAGLAIKSIRLTAKERICLNDRMVCSAETCPYARGHFDRVNEAIIALFESERQLSRERILDYAERFQVCPHEFQLDMSDYSDFVLCDYNYAFDPKVYLRRAFDSDNPNAVLLVDEAHNLIDRGREMFSAELRRSALERMADFFRAIDAKAHAGLIRRLDQAAEMMSAFHREIGGGERTATEQRSETFYLALKGILTALDPFLSKAKQAEGYDDALNFSYEVLGFTRIDETWQTGFLNLLMREDGDLIWRIQCIDTSALFAAMLTRVRSGIFFSATLSPMPFYMELLGGNAQSLRMRLPSPFPSENFAVYQASLSTRYKDRDRTLDELVRLLHTYLTHRPGNYMVFFPSYAYLSRAAEAYTAVYGAPSIVQSAEMTEQLRAAALERYGQSQSTVGFFVLGGTFSEGIDLVGEQLIGCAVVSVGMPGLSFERDVIRDYFEAKHHRGFDYAYTFPGMNKILQAAGRVIRTPQDRGSLLLIDDRFAERRYQALMPPHWADRRQIDLSERTPFEAQP